MKLKHRHFFQIIGMGTLLALAGPLIGKAWPQANSTEGHSPTEASECVVLLHGMGRTSRSMARIETALRRTGYWVYNESYPSTDHAVETLAPMAILPGLDFCRSRRSYTVHFVTHSLGGILVRYYFQDQRARELTEIELGRVVMLAPPNKGSEVADLLKDNVLYKLLTGPAGQQLGTDASGLPVRLKPIGADIGVIAGNKSSDPWFSPFLSGSDDGKVSVDSTQLGEMRDFLIVDKGHTLIMYDAYTIRQTIHFLRFGRFEPH
ncbi:MAG: hypothetical protein AAF402_16915 [Pseudomonadota bacterium]